MWLTQSNRLKHFVVAMPCAIFGSILFVAGLALGMEFKDDTYGGKFDWLDLLATLLGGAIGQVVQILIYTAVIQ